MLTLEIISPEKIVFRGQIDNVKLPGTAGRFEVLVNHAPLISSLEPGVIEYTTTENQTHSLEIDGGVVGIQNNTVSVCVELKV